MLFIPLPFVVTLLLLILLAQVLRRETTHKASGLFIALISLYALLSVLIGVRWGYDVRFLLPLQSVLAASWASLAWLAFRQLAQGDQSFLLRRDWKHALPSILIVALVLLWPEPIDLALIVIYLGYGGALLRVAYLGTDTLTRVRLNEGPRAHRALVLTGLLLVTFALVDLLISLDIRYGAGHYSALIVSLANLPALVLLGLAATVAENARGDEGDSLVAEAVETQEDTEDREEHLEEDLDVLAVVEALLKTREVYGDFDLTLDRLARKSGIQARKISGAINRLKGQNVSQYVNAFRVAEACRLLSSTDQPVTSLMLEAGFITKSNFNREFRRVTGMSPKEWRQKYPQVVSHPEGL